MATTAGSGCSVTPLARKLGVAAGCRVCLLQAPPQWPQWVAPLPPGVVFDAAPSRATDVVHLFAERRSALQAALAPLRSALRPDATVWVSWPKRASRVPTDITEDTVREIALPLGWVDVKVCAVDDVWSALKLVLRKELRPAG